MPKTPSLLNRQSQDVKDKIVEMAKTQHLDAVVVWLNDHGVDASYGQVQYFVNTHTTRIKQCPITPVKGYAAKVRLYVGALLEYNANTFTHHNLRMHGSCWSNVATKLHRDGLIEPVRNYTPKRWRILATKDELREWCEKETDSNDHQ